jgi:sugar phosphate isomerase/epimerase
MKYAVFTCSTPDWTPEEGVREFVDAGYDGVEWRIADQQPVPDGQIGFWAGNRCTWPWASFPDDAARLRALTDGAGLAISGLGTYVRCDDPESVDTAMRVAASIGVEQLRVTVPKYDPAESYNEVFAQRRREYAEVAKLAGRHGVRALLEIHHRTPVPSPHSARELVDGLDPEAVGVIHDIGNMVFEGWTDYRMSLEALGPYLRHVHLKSGQWVRDGQRADGSTNWSGVPARLRDGIVDVPALFVALRQVGYDRWITFEDFSTDVPLAERIRDNLAYAKAAERAAAAAA